MKKKLEILWEGYLPLKNVLWTYDPSKSVIFSNSVKEQCNKYWIEMTKQYPEIYDGHLITVNNIDYSENEITFQLGNIRYSELTYHYKNNLPLENSLGSFGFQALIYNLTHTHILLGQRTSSSDYRPKYYGTPGGIFETVDAKGSITDACIREIQEETLIAIKPETMRVLAIFREESLTSVGLIIEVEALKEKDSQLIEGNKEWENRQLQWFPISKLVELDESKLMDSLFYAKYM